jgi:hypothetical protein
MRLNGCDLRCGKVMKLFIRLMLNVRKKGTNIAGHLFFIFGGVANSPS